MGDHRAAFTSQLDQSAFLDIVRALQETRQPGIFRMICRWQPVCSSLMDESTDSRLRPDLAVRMRTHGTYCKYVCSILTASTDQIDLSCVLLTLLSDDERLCPRLQTGEISRTKNM